MSIDTVAATDLQTNFAPIPACANPVRITECCSWEELDHYRSDWVQLLADNPNLGIFCTPEWLGPWWHAYGYGRSLMALVFADQHGETVGVAPLYRERSGSAGFIKANILRLVGDGSGDSDDLDFVVRPGYEGAVAAAFLHWAERKPWHICELNCLSPRSTVATHLLELLRIGGWKHVRRDRALVSVQLPETWALFLKQLSSKERGKVGNRLRRLETRHQLTFHRCEQTGELAEYLGTLFSLHQKRWESRAERGSFSQPQRVQFYRGLCALLTNRGWLELWTMKMDGMPVAAQIGLRYRNSVSSLQEGFDPDYSADSVGYVLRSHVLRSCIASGINRYEFLAGDQDSKQRWGAEMGNYIDIRFAHPGCSGAAHFVASESLRSIKGWFRERLPQELWKKLQQAKGKLVSN
ncbi:GNAT family N-acetyltransferase [Acidobacteria bacterium AB60]|nr:GNAT family N-acetyltransferase [Acidobacteria bacterium AB60]